MPSLPVQPRFTGKTRRRLRKVLLIATAAFAVLLVLGMIVSAFLAGSIQFWHTWGWFGFGA